MAVEGPRAPDLQQRISWDVFTQRFNRWIDKLNTDSIWMEWSWAIIRLYWFNHYKLCTYPCHIDNKTRSSKSIHWSLYVTFDVSCKLDEVSRKGRRHGAWSNWTCRQWIKNTQSADSKSRLSCLGSWWFQSMCRSCFRSCRRALWKSYYKRWRTRSYCKLVTILSPHWCFQDTK